MTAYKMLQILRLTHGASDVRYGRCCLGCWSRITAALRMKGVCWVLDTYGLGRLMGLVELLLDPSRRLRLGS